MDKISKTDVRSYRLYYGFYLCVPTSPFFNLRTKGKMKFYLLFKESEEVKTRPYEWSGTGLVKKC